MMISFDEASQTSETLATASIEAETDQRAFIYYDAATRIQRLVLDVRTAAFAGDFGWIVPIPHQPADAQSFLDTEVVEVDGAGFDELSAATEPTVELVRHYVTETATPGRSGGFFACSAPLAGDGLPESTSSDKTEAELEQRAWGTRSTENYDLSLYSGSDFEAFLSFLEADAGFATGTPDILRREPAYSALAPYFVGGLVEGDDRAGPFSILILRSTRARDTTPPAVQIDFPTDVPFFALTVSRPALAEEMNISLLLAGSEAFAPEAAVQAFKLELNMDEASYSVYSDELLQKDEDYRFGAEVDFSGEIYYSGRGYYIEDQLSGEGFLDDLGAAVRGVVRLESEAGYIHDATLSITAGDIPFLDGSTGDTGTELSSDDELWLSRYRRTATSWEHLSDLTFAPVETDGHSPAFTGKTVAHVSVDAEESTAATTGRIRDLSILFPLAFPVYISIRRVMRKAGRSSRARKARRG